MISSLMGSNAVKSSVEWPSIRATINGGWMDIAHRLCRVLNNTTEYHLEKHSPGRDGLTAEEDPGFLLSGAERDEPP